MWALGLRVARGSGACTIGKHGISGKLFVLGCKLCDQDSLQPIVQPSLLSPKE